MKNERGQSQGNAIIEFSSQQDADYVVKSLNGSELDNRSVNFQFKSAPGQTPGGGYGRGSGKNYQGGY